MDDRTSARGLTRRQALKWTAGAGLALAAGALAGWRSPVGRSAKAAVFVAKATDYSENLFGIVRRGLAELGLTRQELAGKRVLVKPHLAGPHAKAGHTNTHPLAVRATAAAFLSLGAAEVAVGEGAGHRRDALLVLEESGLTDVLASEGLIFHDLNTGPVHRARNAGHWSRLGDLWLPDALDRADIIVSVAKMKTHHRIGASLSMENLLGVMPGSVYGWPKNVGRPAGIQAAILDINATVRPSLAIVDGIVGMEGDGPRRGDPVRAGVLVMGRNPVAVDATACRIMGIDPTTLAWLRPADGQLGPIDPRRIAQRGENPADVRHDFVLPDHAPAPKGLRPAPTPNPKEAS